MRNSLIETMTDRLQKGLDTAKHLGASATKIGFYHQEKTDCQFEAGRLKDTGGRESISYSVEVLVGNKKGNTSGNRLEDFNAMIERAVTLAKVGGSVAHFDAYPAPSEAATVKTHSNKTLALSREKMIEACQQIADELKTYNPDLFIDCSASRTESESLLLTTGGVSHPAKRTHWRLGASVQLTADTDMLFAGHSRGWRDLTAFYDPGVIAEKIITDLRRAETIVPPPSGKVKAHIPPETLPRLLWPLFMGTNGRNVAKGDSPLAGRLEERVLSSSLTITDDPHQDYATGARSLDDNGVPTMKQTLFDKGILKCFLYDLDSAGLAGATPTGNNGSNPHSPKITPGKRPSGELLAEIDDGLYIRDLIGFGQSNIINGDFSGNLGLGYRVRDGEIVGRVKNTMIAGNLYEILKHNVLVSSDTDYQGRYPHMTVEGMSVVSDR
ncbi:MAG: TldD/PmbA family protein [Deltaproteobacteria bacterium]|nr:TldD/PmbA family protein [Deltaproteobacteria bacterium]MBW2171465.1 TldD/PmbA family protein [Deltaproteobacteria bacterium]